MIDVLFVNPPSPDGDIIIRDINRSGRKTRERMIWPQTNLAYLAAVLKDKYSVELIDCIALKMQWKELQKLIEIKKPRYIVSNVISTTLTNDMYTMFLGKSIGAVTIGTGPHLTELYEDSFKKFPSIDYAIRGEAEITVRQLIDTIEMKGDISAVEGIVYRDGNGRIIATKDRPFIEDLDSLPIPMHELLPLNKYRVPFFGNYTFIVTSRGCPYKCIFCRQIVMWKGKFRTRSAENILKEIKYLINLGVKNILFQADTFTVDKKVVIELCRKIIENNINIRWACNTHISSIDEEMVKWMKKAGCWMIAAGIESGSQQVLDMMKKGTKIGQIRKVVKFIHDSGIEVWGYFIIGLPGETKETIEQTIKFSLELPLDMANFAVGAPYPGTEFYVMARDNKWLTAKKWEDFDQNYSAIVGYPHLTTGDIIKGIKRANIRFFSRPKHAFRILREFFSDISMANYLMGIIYGHICWAFSGEKSGAK